MKHKEEEYFGGNVELFMMLPGLEQRIEQMNRYCIACHVQHEADDFFSGMPLKYSVVFANMNTNYKISFKICTKCKKKSTELSSELISLGLPGLKRCLPVQNQMQQMRLIQKQLLLSIFAMDG